MDTLVSVALFPGVITLLGYLAAMDRIRQESGARRDVERDLASVKARLERLNLEYEKTLDEASTARSRFLELAIESAGKITTNFHELRNHIGAFHQGARRGDLKRAIDALNSPQLARRELLTTRVYLPPDLDLCFDEVFGLGAAVVVQLGECVKRLSEKQGCSPLSKSDFAEAALKKWDAAVVTWKNEVWQRAVSRST
ncbi:MAG TPA: hypothetical protein VF331_27435 [Polyangiales bacterium]